MNTNKWPRPTLSGNEKLSNILIIHRNSPSLNFKISFVGAWVVTRLGCKVKRLGSVITYSFALNKRKKY